MPWTMEFNLRVKQQIIRLPANFKKFVEISKLNSHGMEPNCDWPTEKIPEFNLAIRMKLQFTIYAISSTPKTFPQTSRIVVAAIKAFNHFIFTVFNAIVA